MKKVLVGAFAVSLMLNVMSVAAHAAVSTRPTLAPTNPGAPPRLVPPAPRSPR